MLEAGELEQHVVRAAQAGDRAAFDELVLRHKASLYRFVRRYVGDADDAYDVLQNTFVAAWLALRRFDSGQPLGAWLRAIALNKCRDYGRRRAVRRRFLALFASESASGWIQSDHPTAGLESGESRYLRQLDQAIAALPRRYKEPLLLTWVAGLTQRQAAEQLGTSPKAIEMRIRRAKESLGQALLGRPDRGNEPLAEDLGMVVVSDGGA